MMNGHEMMRTTKKPKTITTTAKPNSYDDQSFDEEFNYEASAKVESVSKFLPNHFVNNGNKIEKNPPIERKIITGIPEYRLPNVNNNEKELPFEIISFRRPVYKNAPLDGPMVVKVYPDGTPVDDQTTFIEDEDLKHYKLLKQRLPTFQ